MGRKIVLKENRSEYIIEDDSDIRPNPFKPEEKYPNLQNQEKCDYIVEITSKVLFVELKGTNFEKGMAQLENTVMQLNDIYSNNKKCCYYVGRNIPSAKTTLPKYKENFRKRGAKLVTKTKKCVIKTSSILECKCDCK